MMSQQIRDQKKKISKVFEYFTGDEFDEFDHDFKTDELLTYSEDEKAGDKDDDESNSTNLPGEEKTTKTYQDVHKLLARMDRLDQVFT